MALGAAQCHQLTSLWETAEQDQDQRQHQHQQEQGQEGGGKRLSDSSGAGVSGDGGRSLGEEGCRGVQELCEKLFYVGSVLESGSSSGSGDSGGISGGGDLAMQVSKEYASAC